MQEQDTWVLEYCEVSLGNSCLPDIMQVDFLAILSAVSLGIIPSACRYLLTLMSV